MYRGLAILAVALAPRLFAADAPAWAPEPLASVVLARIAESQEPACVAVALIEDTTRFVFGCTQDAPPVALDEHSLFEIGSISKAFTGILLADMVLKGEVSLDDPASKYSPPGARLPTRGGREITLRDLATQSSGLPRMPPGFNPADRANPFADFDADKLYEALGATSLATDIGTQYEYSNFGFMWLSEMLARVGGGTYEEVLRKRVLQPLGMTETLIAMDEAQRERFVDGHDAAGKVVPHWDNAPALAGVGGLRSSLADMARFAEAVLGRRETSLKPAIDLALKHERIAAGGMIGLAWHLRWSSKGTTVAWHNGATAGFHSMLAVDRDARRGALVLVNAASGFDDLPLHLLDENVPMRKKRVAHAPCAR
jgi:D-alanyl-D-alanine-carboxypeptidase/D-alanyl-D-alanine-endopeptidase